MKHSYSRASPALAKVCVYFDDLNRAIRSLAARLERALPIRVNAPVLLFPPFSPGALLIDTVDIMEVMRANRIDDAQS